jgi:hypothetical protein
MGFSFTDFRGKGFWSWDRLLEVWLAFLASEAEAVSAPPKWLRGASGHWRQQASLGFNGWIDADLDDRLTDQSKVDLTIGLTQRVLGRLERLRPRLARDYLNSPGTGGKDLVFRNDMETEGLIETGQAFLSLLKGELDTAESTAEVPPIM